jgi:TRAP-type transport system small permease protein
MTAVRIVSEWLLKVTRLLVAIGTVVLFVILLGQVFSRYLMRVPFPWIEELARYLMIWVALLGAGLGLRRKAHVGVTIVVGLFPFAIRRIISVLVYVAMLYFVYILARFGAQITLFVRNQSTTTLPFSFFWAYLAIPVGATLMGLQIIAMILEELFSPGEFEIDKVSQTTF